jgi:hypothetical protein
LSATGSTACSIVNPRGAERNLQHNVALLADALDDLAKHLDRLRGLAIRRSGRDVGDRGAGAANDILGDLTRRDRGCRIVLLQGAGAVRRHHDHDRRVGAW